MSNPENGTRVSKLRGMRIWVYQGFSFRGYNRKDEALSFDQSYELVPPEKKITHSGDTQKIAVKEDYDFAIQIKWAIEKILAFSSQGL